MTPIMFFIVVTLFLLESVTQTLATPFGTPTQAPGTPTQAPGTPTQAPGTPTQAPGTPTQAPGTPTQAPGTPTRAPGTPTRAPGSPTQALSFAPTFAPTSTGYCPAYSASNTNYDTQNYDICSIAACPGDTVVMTTCYPGSNSGYTYLRLYDPFTDKELSNGYGFYYCIYVTYTFTASCRTYELREGCWSSGSCGGQVYYTLEPSTSSPSFKPTHKPTRKPSFRPTRKPSLKPTRKPSFQPTRKPSFRPSRKPTFGPTRKPSRKPTRKS